MITPSNTFLSIKTSETIRISEKANKLIQEGREVINLAASEPTDNTPDFASAAAIEAINKGKTKYTDVSGIPELRKEIVKYYARFNGIEYKNSETIVGSGASQVIYNIFAVTINEGDEVIIPKPYWVSYPEFVKICGGKVVYLDCTDEDNFDFNVEGFSQAISEKTKWLILNSPCNPTGKVLTLSELKEIGIILKQNPNINILCDNIYENAKSESGNSPNLLNIFPELKNRIAMVSGISKAYNMTGWRIGFGAGPEQLIENMNKLQSQTTTNPCTVSQYAAIAALRYGDSFINENKIVYKRKYELMSRIFNSVNELTCRVPEGGLSVFVNCKKLLLELKETSYSICNDIDLALFLVEEAGVAVVPGSAFGVDGFIRISCGQSETVLERACEKIKSAMVNANRAKSI